MTSVHRSAKVRSITLVAALALACAGLAACSGSSDEAVAQPSAPSADEDGVQFCELLDEADREDLAGTALEYPNGPKDSSYTAGGCAWRDDGAMLSTVEVHMTGMPANAWAKDLSVLLAPTLSGPELRDEYEELVESEDDFALLDDAQACALWVEVSAQFATAPRGSVMLDVFTNSSEDRSTHVARAEVCRDGVFAELALISDAPISKARAELARKHVETVWERARDRLPVSDPSGTAA